LGCDLIGSGDSFSQLAGFIGRNDFGLSRCFRLCISDEALIKEGSDAGSSVQGNDGQVTARQIAATVFAAKMPLVWIV
jgi:hypothetical protein